MIIRGLIESVLGASAEEAAISEAADTGYDTAMNMCGNDGQVSIIDMTGYDAFYEAAEQMAMAHSDEALGIVVSACPYPEAVTEILEESVAVMIEIIAEARGDALDQYFYEKSLEMEGEEGGEDDEEYWD